MPVWDADDVIRECVAKYAECSLGRYSVTRWPDKERLSRNTPEIDAFAEAPGSPPLAIEHTRLQSFGGQFMDDSRIAEICGRIESDLRERVPQGITCVVPVFAFVKGFDWRDAEERIRNFVLSKATTLPPRHTTHTIAGVPFEVSFFYEPELRTQFSFARPAPSKDHIAAELTASAEQALLHKKARLQEYLNFGARTLLIMDSEDIALISHVDVYKAFLRAQKSVGSEHLTDVVYAHTSSRHRIWWFAFLGSEKLLTCINLPNLRLGPQYADEWEPTL